jgi:hypothetical protein
MTDPIGEFEAAANRIVRGGEGAWRPEPIGQGGLRFRREGGETSDMVSIWPDGNALATRYVASRLVLTRPGPASEVVEDVLTWPI